MSRVSPQLLVFSYHKSGTSLLLHVMTKVCDRLGLSLDNQFGLVERLSPEPDVVLLPHSLLRARIDWPYRAIRMIRDPRDIWVSGYLYHRHNDEDWCTNADLDPTPPIGWPQVDHSFAHWPEAWKRDYLERLNGESYQRNLLRRSQAEGLDFELDGYTGCTLATMREWALNGVDALDVRLEDVVANFDVTMRKVFDHFGFGETHVTSALEVARSEDVNRMDDAAIAVRPQIHSRTISKWRDVLTEDQVARFEALHGDLIRQLGYERSGAAPGVMGDLDPEGWLASVAAPFAVEMEQVRLVWPTEAWPDAAVAPEAAPAEQTAEVWLSADGAIIRPTIAAPGTYSFVVPRDTDQVWLRSRRGVAVDPRAPYLGDGRSLGVRVSEIAIRSGASEVVIPADDPRLVAGWYDAEQAGLALWRWTDGSAELPWSGVSGPAVVTVRCVTAAECAAGDVRGRVVT
jgi:hypothetical protein